MNQKRIDLIENGSIRLLTLQTAAAIAFAIAISGCTKTRPAAFPDGQGDGIYEKATFTSAHLHGKTPGQTQALAGDERSALRPSTQSALLPVDVSDAPEAMRPMFQNLSVAAKPSSTYEFRFDVTKDYVTAYKVVGDDSELNLIERALSKKGDAGETLVPVFAYKVTDYGQVVRSKNDLNEETRALRLKPTEWSQATHIMVSTRTADRLAITVPKANEDAAERTFRRDRLDGGVYTQAQLKDFFDIQVGMPATARFYTQIDGDKLNLTEVLDYQYLSAAEKEAIDAQDRGGARRTDITRCSDDVKARIGATVDASRCVTVLRYRVPVTHVAAYRKTLNDEGTLATDVDFRPVAASRDTQLIQIARNVQPAEVNPSEQATDLDPARTLVVDKMQGEFLMRRTLEDSPNLFDPAFPGLSGNVEIVRFQFEKDTVRIIRSRPLLGNHGSTSVDLEPLLSLPAQYKRRVTTDERGNPIANPRYVACEPTDAGAIAYIDWTRNRLPNVSTPLAFYEIEQCFSGANEKVVSDVDQRIDQGLLSFSVSANYTTSSSGECLSSDQLSYTFKERISFRKYEEKNRKPVLDVPYETQKRLGFGLFVDRATAPNAYGNTGAEGSVRTMANLWDFSDGKKITYVLAGLPAGSDTHSQKLRQAAIDGTSEVIDEWNVAFGKAFEGTALARAGARAYVDLLVEGDGSPASSGKMGDLDKNYIYFVQKTADSGILGLGGNSSNPRDGIVEAGSVFIYGGNLFSSVDYMRKMARAKKEYAQTMKDNFIAPVESESAGTENPGLTDTSHPGPAHRIRAASMPRLLSDLSALKTQLSRYGARAQTSERDSGTRKADLIRRLRESNDLLSLAEVATEAARGNVLGNQKALEALVTEKLASSRKLQDLIAPRNLSPADRAAWVRGLQKRAGVSKAVARLRESLSRAKYCVYDASDALGAAVGGYQDPGTDDYALFKAMWKPTLAHELGHNFGLRHNFIASTDKANFKLHPSDDRSPRQYSSVMDYLNDMENPYDGLGPYDVAAIRVAYTGLLELAPEVRAAVRTENGRTILPLRDGRKLGIVAGKFIGIQDYQCAVMGVKNAATGECNSWLNFSTADKRKLPIKEYRFCTDEDVGYLPTCNVFDRGTTPQEIVRAVIDDYRSYYSLTNFANDKLRFGWYDIGGYIGRLFSRFIPVRQFLEETLYQAINENQDGIRENLPAAVAGMIFFNGIVRTPDAPYFAANSSDRFVELTLTGGQKIKIERKALRNIGLDESSNRILVRGIEFDKVIAMILLTQRDMGFPRYEQASIRISYPEFERMAGGADTPPSQLPTLGLLTDILSEGLEASGTIDVADGGLKPLGLGPSFKSETTEMLRMFAVIGSILNLDVDGFEAKDNTSALFRVMSGFRAPIGSLTVTQPGASRTDANALRYWAPDSAELSGTVIGKLALLNFVSGKIAALTPEFQTWVVEKITAESPTPTPAMRLLETQLDKKLAKFPEEVGSRKIKEIGQALMGSIQNAMAFKRDISVMRAIADPVARAAALRALQEKRTKSENLAMNVSRQNPLVAVALDALSEKLPPALVLKLMGPPPGAATDTGGSSGAAGSPAAQAAQTAPTDGAPAAEELPRISVAEALQIDGLLAAPYSIESDCGHTFGNVETLNRIFYAVHPEFMR